MVILQEMRKILLLDMSLKIIIVRLQPHLVDANESTYRRITLDFDGNFEQYHLLVT